MGFATYVDRVIWFRRIKNTFPGVTIVKLEGGRYRITIPGRRIPFNYMDGIVYVEPSLTRDMWFEVNRDDYFNHIVTCNSLNKLKDGKTRKKS